MYFDGYRWSTAPLTFTPKASHPTLPLEAGLILYGILIGSLILARVASGVVENMVHSVSAALIALLGLFVLVYTPGLLFVGYARRKWGTGKWESVGWRWTWSNVGWGLLTGVAAVAAEVIVANLLILFEVPTKSNLQLTNGQEPTTFGRFVFVMLAVVIAPFAEELMFRGVVLRSLLSRMHPAVAIGLQGVMFGTMHFDPSLGAGNIGLIVILSTVGCVLGVAAYLRRSIAPTIVGHALFNALAVAVLFSL